MKVPNDLLYTKTHEWVRIDGEMATVGITDYAQAELGDVMHVDLPNVGRSLQLDEPFGAIESVKSVSDLYAPVEGEVVEINSALGTQSELVNSDPYGDGWLVRIRMSDQASVGSLMTPDSYTVVLES